MVGDIGLDGKTLVIRKVAVTYLLKGVADDQRETVQRVLGFHAERCPGARSISPCIAIETDVEYS